MVGFDSISLSNSLRQTADPTIPYRGQPCQWIDLNKVKTILELDRHNFS